MRETGYYWVRQYDFWIIAEYNSELKVWQTYRCNTPLHDSDLKEIDENKITHEIH